MSSGITFRDYKQAVEYLQKLDDTGQSANIRKKGNEYEVYFTNTKTLSCPFCGESGFDKPGLKSHLEHGDCEKYNETESLGRLF